MAERWDAIRQHTVNACFCRIKQQCPASEVEEGLKSAFGDIETLISQCRFFDCKHKGEPGCAIEFALKDGTLSEKCWKTYQSMKREEKYAKERETILTKKQSKTKGKYVRKKQNYS